MDAGLESRRFCPKRMSAGERVTLPGFRNVRRGDQDLSLPVGVLGDPWLRGGALTHLPAPGSHPHPGNPFIQCV